MKITKTQRQHLHELYPHFHQIKLPRGWQPPRITKKEKKQDFPTYVLYYRAIKKLGIKELPRGSEFALNSGRKALDDGIFNSPEEAAQWFIDICKKANN